MLFTFAAGLEGIDGGIGGGGGGGGGRHAFSAGFLPTLIVVASGIVGIAVGAGGEALTKQPSVMASFFTMDLSNLSAMSF